MDSSTTNKYLRIAESLKINPEEEIAKPPIVLKQKNLKSDGYATIGTLGNFSVVIGKAKSRKTFFVGALASSVLSNDLILNKYKGNLPREQSDVAYFDTEQGRFDVQRVQKRIGRISKKDNLKKLHLYHLRGIKPIERCNVIKAVIYANPNIGYVVIDGIRDLVSSINDEEQATEISGKLLKWSEELNIHIVVVLHQNKGNTFARGHLGTELINKAELVLSVTKQNGNDEISVVKPEYSRGIEPESFAFTIVNGLPSPVDKFVEKTETRMRKLKLIERSDNEKIKLLRDVFSYEKDFMYSKLKKQIQLSYGKLFKGHVGNNQTVDFISECKSKKWLSQANPKAGYTFSSSL